MKILTLSSYTIISFLLLEKARSFVPPSRSINSRTKAICLLPTNARGKRSTTYISMAGMGMGVSTKKQKGGGKKNAGSGTSFDVAKACLKSEKVYDSLLKEQAKLQRDDDADNYQYITSEYMVTARIKPTSLKDINMPGASGVSDWVPVAQLCLKRHVEEPGFDVHIRDCQRVLTAVSYYCREINYLASLGSSIFKSIPRNAIEYSVEPIDSFYKFVYEDVIEGKNLDEKNDNAMTKLEARKVLELEEGCNDLNAIKSAYKRLTFKLHPDRFIGKSRTEEEIKQASTDFARVKLAYESLSSGLRGDAGSTNSGSSRRSWYESLGGRARTDFSGQLKLLPLEQAKGVFTSEKYEAAVAGLVSDTIMAFVTRNQAASSK